ncbi:MAG: hypothetical protein D6694_12300 [Gammaproteobacteria bacterium]|nr:MAG: hypothetical protein D6694_12300 [Gammaproteobacteria bacterium]
MARVLGSGEYGAFVYAMTLASLGAMLVIGGMDLIIVRELGSHFSAGAFKVSRLVAQWFARKMAVRAAFVLTGLAVAWFLVPADAPWKSAFIVLGFAFPLMVSNTLWSVLLQAMRRAVWAQALTMALPQLILLTAFGWLLWQGVRLGAEQASIIQVGVLVTLFLIGGWLVLYQHGPIEMINGGETESLPDWNAEAKRLLWFVLLGYGVAKVDLLLLGVWQPIEDVGRYNVASRLAELTSIFLAASNQFMAPRIAATHRNGTREALQQMLASSIRIVFLGTLLVAAVVVIAAPVVLPWYGQDFGRAFWPLVVLVAGQMVNVALGPVGYFLAMVGKSEVMVRAYGLGLLINVGGSLALIPIWGILGAAAANAFAMVAWNLAMYQWIRRNMGINTSIFAKVTAN